MWFERFPREVGGGYVQSNHHCTAHIWAIQFVDENVGVRGSTRVEKRSYPCTTAAAGPAGAALQVDAQPHFGMSRTQDHDAGKNTEVADGVLVDFETS